MGQKPIKPVTMRIRPSAKTQIFNWANKKNAAAMAKAPMADLISRLRTEIFVFMLLSSLKERNRIEYIMGSWEMAHIY